MIKSSSAQNRRETFEAIALVHIDTVHSMAMALTRNPHEAQDLVQETFCKAYRAWHQFQPGTRVNAWLCTILRNTWITDWRKRTYQPQMALKPVETISAEPALSPPWTDPVSVYDRLPYLVQDDVKQALDELPERYRLPVVLADLAECSYREIAAIIDCPVGTVMSRIFRGRKQLRARLHAFAIASGYIRSGSLQTARGIDLDQVTEPYSPLPRPMTSTASDKLGVETYFPEAKEDDLTDHYYESSYAVSSSQSKQL